MTTTFLLTDFVKNLEEVDKNVIKVDKWQLKIRILNINKIKY